MAHLCKELGASACPKWANQLGLDPCGRFWIQVSELRELAMLDPDDAPAAFAAAWGPSGLGPAHVTQLRTALLAALKPQGGRAHGDEEAAGLGTAGAGLRR